VSYLKGLLAEGERVVIETRRHPLFLVGRLSLFVLAALILIAAGIWALTQVSSLLGAIFWLLSIIPIAWALLRFIAWRNERYIVTNFRIIQIEGVLNRRVFDSALEKVNDILLTQSLFGRMFNYGTVEIITGSDIGRNRLDDLSNPFVFKKAIIDARNEIGDDDHVSRHSDDELIRLLASLDDLKSSGLISDAEYQIKRERLLARGSAPRV
jgi:uncharacterized membrane protein YdbT with pleckstrin-like domain